MLDRLRTAREGSGLRQIDVTRNTGIPRDIVSKIETGERQINPIELGDLATAYGVTLDYLVYGVANDPQTRAE